MHQGFDRDGLAGLQGNAAGLGERVRLLDDNFAIEVCPLIDQQRGQQLESARWRQGLGGIPAEQNFTARGIHQQRTTSLHLLIEREGIGLGRRLGQGQWQKQQRGRNNAAHSAPGDDPHQDSVADRLVPDACAFSNSSTILWFIIVVSFADVTA